MEQDLYGVKGLENMIGEYFEHVPLDFSSIFNDQTMSCTLNASYHTCGLCRW